MARTFVKYMTPGIFVMPREAMIGPSGQPDLAVAVSEMPFGGKGFHIIEGETAGTGKNVASVYLLRDKTLMEVRRDGINVSVTHWEYDNNEEKVYKQEKA